MTDEPTDGDARDPLGRWLPGTTPRGAKPWQAGQSGNPEGLRRASERGMTMRQACRLIIQDPQYREDIWNRIRRGKAGRVELFLWQHAFGKPPDVVKIEGESRQPFQVVIMGRGDDPLRRSEMPAEAPAPERPALPEVSFEPDP